MSTTEPIVRPSELLRVDPRTGALRAREYTVSVVAGPDAGRTLPLDERIVVGSHPQNGLPLTDTTVSRYHLELVPRPDGVALRDLESTNGVYLAGVRVNDALVEADALVALGRTKLQISLRERDAVLSPNGDARLGGLVGRSAPMQDLFRLLDRVAPTQATVLLLGETGTGKEVIARAIHDASTRRGKPFVVVDCGAVSPALVESELFGHVRGAFTGAHAARAGAFEEADGGTIFLDEVGELPLDMQPKLLRALEAGTIKRVGESGYRRVDVRVVAATHRDLPSEVKTGGFRADLFYRLSVVVVRVPPLRERRDDIPLLVQHFAAKAGGDPAAISEADQRRFLEHTWPGNVRELKNEVERALVLPASDAAPASIPPPASMPPPMMDAAAFEARRARIVEALARRAGNQTLAARDLGVSRRTLVNWLDQHGFPRPRKGGA